MLFVCPFVDCDFGKACSDLGSVESNTTGLEVILASVGQTGTTSVAQALRSMGYRSYHIEEKMCFIPEVILDHNSPAEFARPISRCKVGAMSLEPLTDSLPHVLEASPEARVILTWRPYPSWLASTMSSGYAKDIPWSIFCLLVGAGFSSSMLIFVLDALTGAVSDLLRTGRPVSGMGDATITAFLLKFGTGLCEYSPSGSNVWERGIYKVAAQEEAYLAHMDEIRRLAGGRLLEFDVKRHSWLELARFLGRPEPPGNPPFPHPRSKDSWTNDTMFDHNLRAGMIALALCLAVLVCKILALRMLVLSLLRLLRRLLRLASRPLLKAE